MKTTITTLFTISLLFIATRSLTYSSGPPASHTNAPGEGTCSSCHGSGVDVTAGTVWNAMTLTPVGATMSTLVQGTTYTFNLTFTDASSVRYGFQLCVLPGGATASSASLGTLISTTAATQLITGGTRTYLEHTSSGTSAASGTKTWTFQWTAPASYTGGATFYVVVNSTDNSSSANFGDVIYPKTFAATVTLPVSWLYTKVSTEKDAVLLNWATASEENNWKFDIERSFDKKEWKAIGEVAGRGNSSVVNTYEFKTERTAGVTYYRVKQTDYNGKYSYSTIVMTKIEAKQAAPSVTFNPTEAVYQVRGEEIRSIMVTDMKGVTRVVLNNPLVDQFIPQQEAGIYLVQINTLTGVHYRKIYMN
jgi:hypothetical protein